MPIVQQGSINTTALIVPDLYVQIVPPQNLVINGVPTNIIGVVGSASWGPVGVPAICSTMADYAKQFGPVINRKFDLGTPVATAVQQGASNFRCVRVTDGTDTAATAVFGYAIPVAWVASTAGITLGAFRVSGGAIWSANSAGTTGTSAPTPGSLAIGATFNDGSIVWTLIAHGTATNSMAVVALYSGSLGNQIQVTLTTGSAAGSWRLIVALPGLQPEVFDNITGTGGAGNFWANLQAAINFGNGPTRGPSQLVYATGGGSGNAGFTPAAGSTFAGGTNSSGTGSLTGMIGGTDGAGGVTATTLVGVDTLPRKGMYALRGQGCSIGVLSDADDTTQYTTQAAFGLSEGVYMIATGPAGDTIANAGSTKATAGLDTYAVKLMFGDWIYWNDQTNGVLRLVSPQGFVAGRLGNLSPEQSSLNKPLYGVVGSQKSGAPGSAQTTSYSAAELGALLGVGIDVIANPQPAGSFWGVRGGHNSSSNAAVNGDNYTRMTNYIAATLNAGMGVYVGQVINSTLFRRIRSTLLAFLQNMLTQGLLGSTDGSVPFGVVCDTTNNPASRTGVGYVQADTQVQYQAINEKFIVNIEGGQTVQVTRQTLPTGQ
jgi:hypothetical protein